MPSFATSPRTASLTTLIAVALTVTVGVAVDRAVTTQHPAGYGVRMPMNDEGPGDDGHAMGYASGSGGPIYGWATYHGGTNGTGVMTGPPKVYVVYWGSQWGAPSTGADGYLRFASDSAGMAPYQQGFFAGLGTNGESWSNVPTVYCGGISAGGTSCPSTAPRVQAASGGALAGVWADVDAAVPTYATRQEIAQEATAAAAHFGNTSAASNANAQYVITFPPGTYPDHWSGWCAWHDHTGNSAFGVDTPYGDLAFTTMPFVPTAGSQCGAGSVNGSAGALDGVGIVSGHEYVETLTNPLPVWDSSGLVSGGWADSNGEEVADKCDWITSGSGAAANLTLATGTYAVQSLWVNEPNSVGYGYCLTSAAAPSSGGPSATSTVTVSRISDKSVRVGTNQKIAVKATDSAGLAMTYSATGLPAGLTINGQTGIISGKVTTIGTSAVTVTVTDSAGATGSTGFAVAVHK